MKKLIFIAGVGALIGVLVLLGTILRAGDVDLEVEKTDGKFESLDAAVDNGLERGEQIHERTIERIHYVRESVKANVAALPPDSVADELNRETRLFRMAARPGGVDSADIGILGNGTGRARFALSSADIPP